MDETALRKHFWAIILAKGRHKYRQGGLLPFRGRTLKRLRGERIADKGTATAKKDWVKWWVGDGPEKGVGKRHA